MGHGRSIAQHRVCTRGLHRPNPADVDLILFVDRDDYDNKHNQEDSQEPRVAEVIIAKQRNGLTGTVKLVLLKPITQFESLACGSEEAVPPRPEGLAIGFDAFSG